MSGAYASTSTVEVGANPFSRRAVLGIVLLGSALFMALLWMIGTGTGFGSANDGQAHAGSKGLTGYAAMADYLERRGYSVRRVRNEGALDKPGLLVLTPPAGADGKEIDKIVEARRYVGPTLVIGPKWVALPPTRDQTEAKKGWVRLVGTQPPHWPGFLDDVSVDMGKVDANGQKAEWQGLGLAGTLPDRDHMLWGKGPRLMPLVTEKDGRILAALIDDGGYYPSFEHAAGRRFRTVDDEEIYPLVIVFEPDLLDNYGMASRGSAELAETLVRASGVGPGGPVLFDLTLNGLGRADNLLTLAFTPPFLAATLCLLLAALIVGWRAFLRFGPPLAQDRAIAFGKRALVANSAGLVRRSGRLHLLAGPYVDRARERLVQALALPRTLDPEHAEQAIDRALQARHGDAEPFTAIAARLRAARRPHDLLKAARDLHALERMLIQ
ncbi:DUF4350 domain-containing protein [Novosphingobium mangrovi (ex Huang et al. 2023)]|uniref:DUF4350 domain-containing protein n=1 Tax=Novosphingobium mangrovi (ex Huang et al. 2023) TaxID=2976432 RepID=A0ABT2I2K8_9SPHN|nr:DUF4350 domain-containing protein [Novosphingobium mangrovi (ex Huang et al. 2023)]MCT2399031.1 DUF4350 domain-containing protein [Novosphingobium mangrovi (ex Huang et al. 2023)]